MDVKDIENKLLADIDTAYKEAIDSRVKSARDYISDFITYYKTNGISLFGLADLNAVAELSQIATSDKLPSLIKIGYCRHRRNLDLNFNIPALIDMTSSKGLNVLFDKSNAAAAHNFIQNIALRYLLSLPENRIQVSIFDAASNGANYSYLLALEKIKSKLYTSESEIGNKLNEIVNSFTHIQTNILSFKYDSLEDYNAASEVKLPYQLILISNYPDGFTFRRDTVIALKKIIENGPKYGVIVLMTMDTELDKRQNNPNEIESAMGRLSPEGHGVYRCGSLIKNAIDINNYNVELDTRLPANKVEIIDFLNNRYAEQNKQADSLDSYYEKITKEDLLWKKKSDRSVDFVIGIRNNFPDPQGFHFGQSGTVSNSHALIGGQTGSGKSVLINNIIINAAYNYSPEELQFYVIDLKGGEYPDYKNLPHIKVLFQDAQKIDVALNVLESVQQEYFRRVKLFQSQKMNEIANYKAQNKISRLVLIIDEFQTFNQSENFYVKAKSKEILEFLITKGRAYGIHVILASQHLANANLSTTALDNIRVRLVLPLSVDGCHYILSRENSDPEKLKNLELIYNDQLGYKKENNIQYKIPYLKEALLTPHIDRLQEAFKRSGIQDFKRYFMPGNAHVPLEHCLALTDAWTQTKRDDARIFLGNPYFIQEEDSYIGLLPEIENNILLVGLDARTSYGLIYLITLQFLNRRGSNKAYYLQYTPRSSKYYDLFADLSARFPGFSHARAAEADAILSSIEEEISKRKEADGFEQDILFILPQLNIDTSLNKRNDPLVARIKMILEKGPVFGVFTLIYVDSYNSFSAEIDNISRWCKFKVGTKGGESGRLVEKKEVQDEGFIYLSAPDPYTSMKPDLIHVYNSYTPEFLNKLDVVDRSVVFKLFNEIE